MKQKKLKKIQESLVIVSMYIHWCNWWMVNEWLMNGDNDDDNNEICDDNKISVYICRIVIKN